MSLACALANYGPERPNYQQQSLSVVHLRDSSAKYSAVGDPVIGAYHIKQYGKHGRLQKLNYLGMMEGQMVDCVESGTKP